MGRHKLAEAEIEQRLVRLTNLERLHVQDQQTKAELRAEVKQLRQDLIDQRRYFTSVIEAQAAQIIELQTMVFGRNRYRSGGKRPPAGKARAAASYRRPKPSEDEVTSEEHHPTHACRHFIDKTTSVLV